MRGEVFCSFLKGKYYKGLSLFGISSVIISYYSQAWLTHFRMEHLKISRGLLREISHFRTYGTDLKVHTSCPTMGHGVRAQRTTR